MCGIIGYTGPRQARGLLLEGLRRLEYRGYDSAGLAVHGARRLQVHRAVGRVAGLEATVPAVLEGTTGIAHTRWATHGGVTLENAHPHMDTLQRIAVVHNGIIENMGPLKTKLQSEGVRFRSETDSEILAHLIARFYEGQGALDDSISPDAAGDPLEAVRAALARVRGTWGIAVVFADHPDVIICARNGSPLVVGLGEGETFIASDPHALTPHTRRVVFLEDGEIARLDHHGVQTQRLDGGAHQQVVQELDEEWGDAEKGDFPNFMLKEIHEQPTAISDTIAERFRDGAIHFDGLGLEVEDLREIRRVLIVGCGTALHAGLVGRYLFEDWGAVATDADVASEWRYRNGVFDPSTLVVAISQSGETADTLAAMEIARERGARVVAVTNIMGSAVSRVADGVLYTRAGLEIGVAATKTFTSQVALLTLFALHLAEIRGRLGPEEVRAIGGELEALPGLVERILVDRALEEQIAVIADRFAHDRFFLYLGRHLGLPICQEGALKLKEISYIPTDAYPAGEMKHGPIALLGEDTPVVAVATDSHVFEKMASNIEEVRARGAHVVAVATEGNEQIERHAEHVLWVPRTRPELQPILAVIPLQLLAYQIAQRLGLDVDRPRNLAKTVTVE